jgi:gamma-glutamyltranspeptidase
LQNDSREHPPNGQGIAALIALKILDGITAAPDGPIGSTDYDDPSRAHHLIEAVRLGEHRTASPFT